MNIAIVTRQFKNDNETTIIGIPQTYLKVIKHYGNPIIIDSTLDVYKNKQHLLYQIKQADFFIIPGGDTINDVDLFIIDYCYKNDYPLLGICLGMQEIAYYFNSESIISIDNLSHFDIRQKYLHEIKLNENGHLYNLLNTKSFYVNSRHKYKVLPNSYYTIEATCNDVIEAIKVKNKKYILGVQFHPEIMFEYDVNAKMIFDDFFNTKT